MVAAEKWYVRNEAVGEAPFLGARREAGDRKSSVRPRVANIEDTANAHQEQAEGDGRDGKIIWWEPRMMQEEEEEEPERHPAKWWSKEEETRNGLGQDGLRAHPQEEDEKEEQTDWRKVRGKKKIYKPTAEEITNHEKHHCPFRAWCKHCVRGRANNAQHRHQDAGDEQEEGEKVPRIAMDYVFMSKKLRIGLQLAQKKVS